MAAPTLRSRPLPLSPSSNHQDSSSSYPSTDDDAPPSKAAKPQSPHPKAPTLLDILRLLTGLLLLNTSLSYLLTSHPLWTYRPPLTRPARMRAWLRGPLLLSSAQLALYNGSDARLPILLALNGSVYDVSAGKRFYGPGGMYSFFAGRDASRAFVTGCFEEDLVGDLRGVEEMFLEVGGVEGEEGRESEWRVARQMVVDTVEGWERLFDGGKGGAYFRVGKVVREEGWEERLGPVRELCEKARRGRVKRGQASRA